MAQRDEPSASGLTVVLTGAESSGKTTLAQAIAAALRAPWVPEFAREHLRIRTNYGADDLVIIAEGQLAAELRASVAHPVVVTDTDVLVVKVWHQVRYGTTEARIEALLANMLSTPRRRLYLVTRPDIPWEPDPLREHPGTRADLHALHLALLASLDLDYVELSGTREARLADALQAIGQRAVLKP